jgi:Rieske Fe-S protein
MSAQSNTPPPPSTLPRRRFVSLLFGSGLIASAASFLYPILKYLVPPKLPEYGNDAVVAARVSEIKPNEGKIFRFGSKPGLLIQISPGEYRALSAVCTHLGCTVQYRSDLREVWCACHNGMYDINGRNISGPPPRPLTVFEVQVRGDEIFVRRKAEG